MDFHKFNRKINEHFDQCDLHDTEKKYYLDQQSMNNWVGETTTILGNEFKLYDTVYVVMWAFAVRSRQGIYEHLVISNAVMTRDEIKDLYEFCSEFEVQLDVWGKFVERSKKPNLKFRYAGGVMMTKFKEDIGDFTWKDDILLKTLLRKRKDFTNIWALLREAQAREEVRRARIEQNNKINANKLYPPGNARRR